MANLEDIEDESRIMAMFVLGGRYSEREAADIFTMMEGVLDFRDRKMRRFGAAKALVDAAQEIEREMICCDAYDGSGDTKGHDICYWSGANRATLLQRASETEDGSYG